MPRFKLISLTTPLPGKEAAFDDWYQNTHLPELVALDGVVGAQRYRLVAKLMGGDTNPFLAIYDVECDDPRAFLGALGEATKAGRVTPGTASDMSTNYTALFGEHGERVGI
jgi:hypothetical protein